MEDLKPNSHKYREAKKQGKEKERQKLDKIVSGSVKTKKKSMGRKLTDSIFSEDATNVKSYILADVIVPAAKKLISDIVKDGIEMVLYGSTGGKRSKGFRGDYISYNRFSDRRDERPYPSDSRSRTVYSYEDIILENRGEAESVLSTLDDLIEMYGQVTVMDLYDLVGISGNYTDDKYGWTNLRNAEPVRCRDGYMLRLPKAVPLK